MTGLLSRTSPIVLLVLSGLGLIASLAIVDLPSALTVLVCYAVAGLVLMPRRSGPMIRYVAVILGSVSIGWSSWLVGTRDLETAMVAGLRIIVLALPGVAVAPLIDPSALADHLGQRLRLPARPVVSVAAALQRMDQLGQTWQQLARTRRARGLGPGRGPVASLRFLGSVTFGLLVATLRQSAALAIAMDARGFADNRRRSWAEPAPWSRWDTTIMCLGVIVTAIPYLMLLR